MTTITAEDSAGGGEDDTPRVSRLVDAHQSPVYRPSSNARIARAIRVPSPAQAPETGKGKLLQPNDGERYDVETPADRWSACASRERWKNDALMLRSDLRTAEARIKELEGERDHAWTKFDAAAKGGEFVANYDLVKAESAAPAPDKALVEALKEAREFISGVWPDPILDKIDAALASIREGS